ncbi:uncharacterized protein LOC142238606 [Haematobia irritans]|uniref:uncharacterized protein LOC142238606 n=1 Tax=Haematobia irritans TaxID=7368 RepID=UPI003F4F5658
MAAKEIFRLGYIIGTVSAITSLLLTIAQLIKINYFSSTFYIYNDNKIPIEIMVLLIFAVTIVLTSFLMIAGIAKKSKYFLLPWLITIIVLSVIIDVFYMYQILWRNSEQNMEHYAVYTALIGIEVIAIYPIVRLLRVFGHTRSDKEICYIR